MSEEASEELIQACRNEDIDTVRRILENRNAAVNYIKGYLARSEGRSRGWIQRAPIHWACENDNLELLTLLLENGANPNIQNSLGETPLHLASPKLAPLLFQNGADPNIPDNEGNTLLHNLCNIFVYMDNMDNKFQLIRMCLDNGADINMRNSEGKTPFFLACEGDEDNINQEALQFLVSLHADVNIPDNERNTPLHLACKNRNIELVKFLVFTVNARTNIRDNNGMTPIELTRDFLANYRHRYAEEHGYDINNLPLYVEQMYRMIKNNFQQIIDILQSKEEIQDSANINMLTLQSLNELKKDDKAIHKTLSDRYLADNIKSYVSKPTGFYKNLLGQDIYNSFVRSAKSLLRPQTNTGVVARTESNKSKSKKGGKRKMQKTMKRKMKKTIKRKMKK